MNNDGIRVLYLVRSLKRCGPVNVLFYIIKNLDRNIFSPVVITFKAEGSDSRIDDFKALGVEIYSEKNMRQGIKKIKSILTYKSSKIIVHSHGILPDFVNTLFNRKNVVNISTIHNKPIEDYILTFGKIKGRLLAEIHYFLLRKLKIVSCSESVGKSLKEHTRLSYVSIRNGVPFDHKLVTNSRICGREINVVYVGSLSELKNVDFLIKAVLSVVNNNVNLTIVGGGPKYKILKERYKDEPKIIFVGFKKDTTVFFQNADVFASSSLSEGLPMAVIESLSFGKPVLLSDIESHKEIMNQGRFGKLFKNNNIDSFVHSFQKIIDLVDKEKMIHDNAQPVFSDKVMSKKYQDLYLMFLNESS
ncbi:glycosyltransferase family 4 protein [Weissella paramesenteroides]|uniref:Glycosyltransferase, group 1 family protein n=1 Tax=Weissella paramesenteroides ATCC 33313 TaxID=585506 RepID=C5RB65_WEIPA|nr:glycosyltransferase family 4 protein [Weissella paramesenteroides]ATF41866.1 glycosyl transferase [Weissella paramesenteroides]EER74734.1 glycosyltransferase, group 1 family protein [Weissella paramesenteroides ATCC 33313]